MARKARNESYSFFLDNMNKGPYTEKIKTVAACIRAKVTNARSNQPSTRRIKPNEFTQFIATQFEDIGATPGIDTEFNLDEDWTQDVELAIRRAPKNKATGGDEVFAKALQLVPTEAVRALCSL